MPGGLIWEGASGGLQVHWTTSDLRITNRQGASYSRADALRSAFDREMAGPNAPAGKPCVRELRISLLSVVGPMLSLRESTTTTCEREAHPAAETRFVTLDFSKMPAGAGDSAARRLDLADLFPERAVLGALRSNAAVRQSLEATSAEPTMLMELVAELAKAPPVLDNSRCFSYPEDLLTRFAFEAVQGNTVTLELGLPGAAPCRDSLTQIPIALPIPSQQSAALTAAASRAEGFLMKDAGKIAQNRVTALTFRTAQ
jgi:hypothetical protein